MIKRPKIHSSSVPFPSRFCFVFFGLLIIGYFSLPIGANGAEPVKILSKPFHLGDQEQNDMTNAKPDGKVFEASSIGRIE